VLDVFGFWHERRCSAKEVFVDMAATGDKPGAIRAYRTMLSLNPPDQPEIRFRLARILHAAGDAAAKREVLLALEEAPRFREAHTLLIELDAKSPKQKAEPPKPRTPK
jgi:tetratricopeptide (TPR) repeat protein